MFGTYQTDSESSGSGIIIGENDTELLIVTNYHVVSGSNELSVVFSYDEDNENPSVVSAKIKGYDSDKDLAVISVSLDDVTDEMRSQIKVATIGDSSSLVLGQEVVAIGNALGYGQSVTTGIISALNREVTLTDDNGDTITNKLIQTDAAINPGNSGGALLNMNGELIGINSAKVASDSVEGMGYAIPISDVQSIIEDLMLKETRDVVVEAAQGYIGISGTDVTSEISSTYDMPMGIYVNSVSDDSPAKDAGLTKGIIITKFDGQTVKTMSELKNLLTYYRAGETVDITAQVPSSNGYDEQVFSLTLGFKESTSDSGSSNSQQEQPSNGNGNGNYYSNPFGNFWNMP
jgi:serine protease Do